MRPAIATLGFVFLIVSGGALQAASLMMAPTNISLVAPDSAATLTLRNEDTRPLNVQIRVFRWSQAGGSDRLEPTEDVVASPPLTTLNPESEYTVRVVRVAKSPVVGEESYRLLVDEIPDATKRRPGAINFVLRYSVPVFIASQEASSANVAWSVQPHGNSILVTATNSGARHLRIADLKVANDGKVVSAQPGLAGYILSGASMRWSLPLAGNNAISGRSVTLSAQGDAEAVNAKLTVPSAR